MTRRSRRLPSLNGLRVFDVVARHPNFRLAAEELGVTQGAVAQQIRALEAELGIRLFERHPRTLALTEAAQGYAISIRRAFELIGAATERLQPAPAAVTISVTPTFAAKWLIPRLPDFTAHYPDMTLRIHASEKLAGFGADGVDIAVRQASPPFAAGLDARLLFAQRIVAVASPMLIEKLGRPHCVEDLAAYALLDDAHHFWPRFLEKTFPGKSILSPRRIVFNQTSFAIDAAIGGQGVALANPFLVADSLADGRLQSLFDTVLQVEGGFYVVCPGTPPPGTPVAAVRDWLAGIAQREDGSAPPAAPVALPVGPVSGPRPGLLAAPPVVPPAGS
ncbi:LysR family transcriptional regulator [Acetobacter sp. TBRC 12305]|uniref:LysR family transcriptional regulator n=1 Tax=Acetobacter garciniae TaxID=2817435 RepID=A0A939HQ91_9PROT|nr:LysR substrate-binding domain-containing protein [Acetobacter garciniae]MBO1326088.1 LysR family transcriptional regulator [Acetobacter garciniae]MBX0345167.1 LysR family transcriptional regulator [Acetobacter garciniae]